MLNNIKILWIDSKRDFVFLFNNYIKKKNQNIIIDYFQSLNQVLLSKKKKYYNIIIIDLFLPDSSGIESLIKIHENRNDIPVLVLTHEDSMELAKECLIKGAQDFLIKDKITSESLLRIINYSLIRFGFFRKDKEFKNLIVNNADGMMIVNYDNKILFANEAVGKIFEKKQYELIQKKFGYPVGLNEPINFEIGFEKNRKKNVEIRNYDITWGDEKAYLLILRDFTIEKNQERELKIYKKFMNKSIQGFCLLDLEYKIDNYNYEFVNIICEKKSNISGQHILDYYPDDLKEILMQKIFPNVLKDRKEKKIFYHYCNDKIITTLESFFLIKDENDQPQFIGVIITDITDQKNKEIELMNNEKRLFQFLENIPVGVFIIKSDGTPYFANKNAKHILGRGIVPDISTGQLAEVYNAYLANTDSVYPKEKMPLVKALAGNYTMVEDMEILRNNEKNPIQVWGSPIYNANNEVEYAIAVFVDIKERKIREKEKEKLQNQLIVSEKLSAIGELAAGVAHEFNNALAVIKSSTELLMLMKNLKKINIPEEVLDEIITIEEHTKRASEIVSNLMTVAKPQPPKREMNSVEEIIDDVLKLQNKQFKLENIDVVKNYGDVPRIMIDRGLFIQVFLNLIVNARHAIIPKKKGSLFIRTANDNKFVKIFIKDTGIGIDDINKNKIFAPFFTTKGAYSSDKLNLPGTGLGLSITHKIITQHNGSISCRSIKGEGTEFEINLPLKNG